jgi:hypothetical protein
MPMHGGGVDLNKHGVSLYFKEMRDTLVCSHLRNCKLS